MKSTQTQLSPKDFNKLSTFIYNNYGIKLSLSKKIMVESRLQKRLTKLEIVSFSEYCNFLFSREGQQQELAPMIDLITTNKTDFLREPAHFDFLTKHVLPEFSAGQKLPKPLRIWSAACSSGEEPYTIAMTIEEFAAAGTLKYSILGTDISSEVVQKASTGIYDEERISKIPLNLKKKYFLKGKENSLGKVKISPEIRSKVLFKKLNLMDRNYEVGQEFDIIFCRNVLIYFDKPTQEAVINKLSTKLKKAGYFFLGHSESITGMSVPLQQIIPTVYRKL